MRETLYRLVYTSQLDKDERRGRSIDINVIVAQARENNTALGVTGALLFDGEEFAQVLEGERAEIEEIYERISCDFRHRSLRLLEFAQIDQRNFGDWAMAFVGPGGAKELAAAKFEQMSPCEATSLLIGGLSAALAAEPAAA